MRTTPGGHHTVLKDPNEPILAKELLVLSILIQVYFSSLNSSDNMPDTALERVFDQEKPENAT